jgi:hypothetical protein
VLTITKLGAFFNSTYSNYRKSIITARQVFCLIFIICLKLDIIIRFNIIRNRCSLFYTRWNIYLGIIPKNRKEEKCYGE